MKQFLDQWVNVHVHNNAIDTLTECLSAFKIPTQGLRSFYRNNSDGYHCIDTY